MSTTSAAATLFQIINSRINRDVNYSELEVTEKM